MADSSSIDTLARALADHLSRLDKTQKGELFLPVDCWLETVEKELHSIEVLLCGALIDGAEPDTLLEMRQAVAQAMAMAARLRVASPLSSDLDFISPVSEAG